VGNKYLEYNLGTDSRALGLIDAPGAQWTGSERQGRRGGTAGLRAQDEPADPPAPPSSEPIGF
jgi:hypothetical protein